MRFHDRSEAGRLLCSRLEHHANRPDALVLALPRGGVPVGYEVAEALWAPLDVFLVRKVGLPGNEELAMGAVASGGVRVLNAEVVRHFDVPPERIEREAARQEAELWRQEHAYRGVHPPLEVAGRTVILVDDGLATGSTMRAAARALRPRKPARLVIAVPVASPCACRDLSGDAEEVVCLLAPERFLAVGHWYEDFSQTTDEEVRELLERAAQRAVGAGHPGGGRFGAADSTEGPGR